MIINTERNKHWKKVTFKKEIKFKMSKRCSGTMYYIHLMFIGVLSLVPLFSGAPISNDEDLSLIVSKENNGTNEAEGLLSNIIDMLNRSNKKETTWAEIENLLTPFQDGSKQQEIAAFSENLLKSVKNLSNRYVRRVKRSSGVPDHDKCCQT